MGTNIYLVKVIGDVEKEALKQDFNEALKELRTSRDIYKVTDKLIEVLDEVKDIHICKRSCGWQLLFQSHKDLYKCTWKSLTNYIRKVTKDGSWQMVDEYGDPYSLDELADDLEHFSKGWTGASYDAECRAKGDWCANVANYEYISDKMRWTDSDFS